MDRTNYYETGPSNALPLMLWLDADRMGWLLPTMDKPKLDLQRDVVKNERRQNTDNVPYGRAYETILPVMYPATHPYSWPVIGSHGRPERGVGGGREGVLPEVLRAQQRQHRHSRRFQSGFGEGLGAQVLRDRTAQQ